MTDHRNSSDPLEAHRRSLEDLAAKEPDAWTQARPREKKPRTGAGLWAIAILVLAVGFVAYPYYCTWDLLKVLREGDVVALDHRVNFPSVRAGLKEAMTAVAVREMSSGLSDNPFQGLAMAFVPVLVEKTVDALVTPDGLAKVIRDGKLKAPSDLRGAADKGRGDERQALDLRNLRYAFFGGPTSFRVAFRNDLVLLFRLQDWTWKLNRIYFPEMKTGTVRSEAL